MLDAVVAAAVEELPQAAPPASPTVGSGYIVGSSPSGDWAGHADQLAAYTSGGWRFVVPTDGMSAMVRTSGDMAVYRNGSWEIGKLRGSEVIVDGQKVVGARGTTIASPAGGATADTEARAAIGEILAAMRGHGLIAS